MDRLKLVEAMRAAIPLLNKYAGSTIFNVVLTENYDLVRINSTSTTYGEKFATSEVKAINFLKHIILTLQPHENDNSNVRDYFDRYKKTMKEEILKGVNKS